MRQRLLVGVFLALVAAALVAAPGAFASTEFGDNCSGDKFETEPITIFELSAPGNPLPTAAPFSGVITSWSTDVKTFSITERVPLTLDVLRLDEGAKTARVVAEASATASFGANTFPARIPVQAGDRLALHGGGELGTPYCLLESAEASLGGYAGSAPVGGGSSYVAAGEKARVPVSATIEPDADGDGFGDETEDECPRSAALQTACPVIALEAVGSASRGAANVLVSVSSPAPVRVSGVVRLGKGRTAAPSAAARTVSPGSLSRFALKFPRSVTRRLKRLSPKRKLKLTVTASAADALGQVGSRRLTINLKGQGR